MEPRWVDDAAKLAGLIEELRDEPRYALDTEFHGERTYWPRLALVQVAWTRGIALIDPLALDFEPFSAILGGEGTMVAHASEQDLAIITRACGRGPATVVRHAGRGGLHRVGFTVARIARRTSPRRPVDEG